MPNAKSIDEFFEKSDQWRNELQLIFDTINKTALEPGLKWGIPSFSLDGKNLIGIAGFKKHFCIWFHQGVFLADSEKVLRHPKDGVKSMRQWRMESAADINKKVLRQLLKETIANHQAGKEMKPERNAEYEKSPILLETLASDILLSEQFDALTPGRRKEYHRYILAAKRAATKEQRVEQIKELIVLGLGLNDKYSK